MIDQVGLLSGLLVCGLLFGLGAALLAWRSPGLQTIYGELRLFGLALAVRFACSVTIYTSDKLLRILGDEDGSGWGAGAGLFLKWTQQHLTVLDLPSVLMEAFQGHHRGYGYLAGTLFFLMGTPSRLAAAALNGFFGAVTVVLVSRVAAELFGQRVAVRAGWMACLFPSLIIWSAQTVKEPVVICLECLVLYAAIRIKKVGFSPFYIGLALAAIIGLFPFRFYAAFLSCAAVVLALSTPDLQLSRIRVVPALGLAIAFLAIVTSTGLLAEHEATIQTYDLDRVQTFKNNVATGDGSRSGVQQNYNLKTPGGFAAAIGVGGLHLLFAPFPWQWGGASLRMLAVVPEVLVWWWLWAVALVPGLRYALRRRLTEILPLLLFMLGMGLLYSLMFGNVGLIYRQRAQILPWLLIFAAVGLELRARHRGSPVVSSAAATPADRSRMASGAR